MTSYFLIGEARSSDGLAPFIEMIVIGERAVPPSAAPKQGRALPPCHAGTSRIHAPRAICERASDVRPRLCNAGDYVVVHRVARVCRVLVLGARVHAIRG